MDSIAGVLTLIGLIVLFALGIQRAQDDMRERRTVLNRQIDKVCVIHVASGGRVRFIVEHKVTIGAVARQTVTVMTADGYEKVFVLGDIVKMTRPNGEVLGDWTKRVKREHSAD